MRNHGTSITCASCQRTVPQRDAVRSEVVRPALDELIKKAHPEWTHEKMLCFSCLNKFRVRFIESALENEIGELSNLEREVVKSLGEHELFARDLNRELEEDVRFSNQLADKIATFGGSWKFVSFFFLFLAGWIFINSQRVNEQPLDPFPFILLNLFLSCLAAIQAPIIMMSQNRMEARDRRREENDYRIDLKAELEIRHLHLKLDELMTHQWQRLLEIQQIQTDLLEELGKKKH